MEFAVWLAHSQTILRRVEGLRKPIANLDRILIFSQNQLLGILPETLQAFF